MSATTKNNAGANQNRNEPRTEASVKTTSGQAKPKTTVSVKKAVGAAVLQQSIDAPSASPAGPGEDAAGGRAERLDDKVLVGKGKVAVADKKLKKTPDVDDVTAAPAASIQDKAPQPKLEAAAKAPDVKAAVKSEAPKAPAPKAPGGRTGFKTAEYIVYPAHGVGQITAIEEQEVAGYKLELFVISFIKDKMILKVPVPKVASVGMRKLAEAPVVKRALDTLTGRARVKRTMWSRRAQEYEAKINSGDIVAIAEVVRDLYRSDAQPEQSYSERQLYEAALDRIAREIAVVQKLSDQEALKLIDEQLQKGPRRAKTEEPDAGDEDSDEDTDGIVEAA